MVMSGCFHLCKHVSFGYKPSKFIKIDSMVCYFSMILSLSYGFKSELVSWLSF